MAFKSQAELYQDYITELQSVAPGLTDVNEGSINDILAGVASTAVAEIQQTVIDEFKKTFFSTADGPEVTGGPDDLERLAVDHFGESFRRPSATKSTGTVTFSRPTSGAGNVTIPVGTVVKTEQNSAGKSVRFETTAAVTMTGLSINASVRAIVAGTEGNVQASKVTVIESSLTDSSVVVTNASAFAGGAPAEADAQYRETIRDLIEAIRGATVAAIVAKAKTVAGVEKATGKEFKEYVKVWDVANDVPVGDYFAINRAKLYVADANGTASDALLDDVAEAISSVRAAGVRVDVLAAEAFELDWNATISLNPTGPNYAELSVDPQPIIDEMTTYLQDLDVGEDFDRAAARAYILSKWGPAGTDDLTDFVTNSPSGNVDINEVQKIIPGTLEV